jgi:choline dehydrogenase-like flavoprotein
MADPFDAIIIGSGAGGGTLALHLAKAGKRILILERGPFMPQEKLNWNTSAVFLENRYHTKETWHDKDDKPLHPQQAYFVGGQTKVYGAAMFRMRAEDFGVIHHEGGISPAWPISYADMEPYYTRHSALRTRRLRQLLRSHRTVSLQALSLSGLLKRTTHGGHRGRRQESRC